MINFLTQKKIKTFVMNIILNYVTILFYAFLNIVD